MNVIKNMIKEVNFESMKKNLTKEVFHNLFKIKQVAITSLPVSSATCERSFSSMRRVNTLRTQGLRTDLQIQQY